LRHHRAIVLIATVIVALVGSEVAVANASTAGKAKGYATAGDVTLSFHASGYLSKASGGFIYEESSGYFSGKVTCYIQDDTGTRAGIAGSITKSDDPDLVGDEVTIWVEDSPNSSDRFSVSHSDLPTSCDEDLLELPGNPLTVGQDGYISIR